MNNDDRDVYRRQGFGGELSAAHAPALVIVDFVNGFADPDQFGGPAVTAAIERTVGLLEAARSARWSVAFTRIVFADDGSDANLFTEKVPGLLSLTEGAVASHIVYQLAARPGELVIRKRLPSAFAGTDLAQWLAKQRIDSVVVAGCTTSGCVRATVVDAMGAGFRPLVVSDCVGDRSQEAHDANLFDMTQKYASVLTLDELRDQRAAWFMTK